MVLTCSKCGKDFSDNSTTCPFDGTALQAGTESVTKNVPAVKEAKTEATVKLKKTE